MEIRNDPIKFYYPEATKKMAAEPFYSTYFTYEQFKAFVAKYTGAEHLGYHGHYTGVYEPVENNEIGTIGLLFHNSPTKQEYLVSYTPAARTLAHGSKWYRPVQTYWLKDLNTVYALMIAIAYPNMQLWESYLTGFEQGTAITPEAAVKKYQGMVPAWKDFTEEQMKQFVKNLEI